MTLVREFSCCDGEFDVATGLEKTNSFFVATVWHCVAHDREGQTCETPRKSNFMKNGKMVISVKIQNFSRSRMTKRTSLFESSRKI